MRRHNAAFSEAMATRAQIQVIQIAKRELGMEDEDYRDMLLEHFSVKSSKDLTFRQAKACIGMLQAKGFTIRPSEKSLEWARGQQRKAAEERGSEAGSQRSDNVGRKVGRPKISRDCGKVVAIASAKELEKIQTLADIVTWRVENGFERWMKGRMQVERVRTSAEAFKVIEGLKKMIEGAMRRKHGPTWWTMEHGDPRVKRYIEEHCPAEYRR